MWERDEEGERVTKRYEGKERKGRRAGKKGRN